MDKSSYPRAGQPWLSQYRAQQRLAQGTANPRPGGSPEADVAGLSPVKRQRPEQPQLERAPETDGTEAEAEAAPKPLMKQDPEPEPEQAPEPLMEQGPWSRSRRRRPSR